MHQAKVQYSDGTKCLFLSTDGKWFYEREFPDPHARTQSLRYDREWLKQAAQTDAISSIEFMEV